jgi:hypothetical protein
MYFSSSSNVVHTGDQKQWRPSNGNIMQSSGSVEREYMGGIENFMLYVVRVGKCWRYRGGAPGVYRKALIHGKKKHTKRGGEIYCVLEWLDNRGEKGRRNYTWRLREVKDRSRKEVHTTQ